MSPSKSQDLCSGLTPQLWCEASIHSRRSPSRRPVAEVSLSGVVRPGGQPAADGGECGDGFRSVQRVRRRTFAVTRARVDGVPDRARSPYQRAQTRRAVCGCVSVLMDVRMPKMDGIEAAKIICDDPNISTKVLMLTTFDLDEYVYAAMRAGARGRFYESVSVSGLRMMTTELPWIVPASICRNASAVSSSAKRCPIDGTTPADSMNWPSCSMDE
jgi:CheY-like chemotaxis protein